MALVATAFHQSAHLSENMLGAEERSCHFCGSPSREKTYILQTDPLVELLFCSSCNASSASRFPSQEALQRYYSGYYKQEHGAEQENHVTFDDHARFGRHIASLINLAPGAQLTRILDFGGGDGSMSYALAESLIERGAGQIELVVIDHDRSLVGPKSDKVSVIKIDSLDQLQNRYDVVLASAILEHLTDAMPTVSRLLQAVEKGGWFYARTPYVAPLAHVLKFFRIKWDFTFPAHIHDLGQEFWEKFFAREFANNQFELVHSAPSIVETTLSKNFARTLAAYLFKAPWYILGKRYKLVGGWEVCVKKSN